MANWKQRKEKAQVSAGHSYQEVGKGYPVLQKRGASQLDRFASVLRGANHWAQVVW